MTRKRSRFSQLDRALRAAGGQAAAGSRLAEYKRWRGGEKSINVTGRPPSEHMQRIGVGLLPFALTPAASTPTRYLASMTVQADNIRALFGTAGDDADFGIERNLENVEVARNIYYPALCRVLVAGDGAVPSTATSGITGGQYQRIKGRSGSIPFGRTVSGTADVKTGAAETSLTEVDEADVRLAITKKLRAQDPGGYRLRGLTFVPEDWRTPSSGIGARAQNAPTGLAPV